MKDIYDKLVLFLKRINVPNSSGQDIKDSIIEYNLQGVNAFVYIYYSIIIKLVYNLNEDTILYKDSYTRNFITIVNANAIDDCLLMTDDDFKEYNFNLFLKCNLI